jgi:hypothetical protein
VATSEMHDVQVACGFESCGLSVSQNLLAEIVDSNAIQ